MVALARLGRAETTVLRAEARPGGLNVTDRARRVGPALDPDGSPSPIAAERLRAALEAAGSPPSLHLVLPPGAAVLRRAEAVLPVRGVVTQGVVADALGRLRAAVGSEGEAVLSCRPTGYAADGAEGEGDPSGRRVGELTFRAAALVAPVGLLAALERAVKAAGAALDGVVPASEALGAACLPDGTGTAVRVAFGETLAARLHDGVVTSQTRVPIGLRHVVQDLGEALGLEPGVAEARLPGALSGEDEAARPIAAARLDELREMLGGGAEAAGIDLRQAVLSGLPPSCLEGLSLVAAETGEDDPLLLGGAYLLLGLRGAQDRAVLAEGRRKTGLLAWLRERF